MQMRLVLILMVLGMILARPAAADNVRPYTDAETKKLQDLLHDATIKGEIASEKAKAARNAAQQSESEAREAAKLVSSSQIQRMKTPLQLGIEIGFSSKKTKEGKIAAYFNEINQTLESSQQSAIQAAENALTAHSLAKEAYDAASDAPYKTQQAQRELGVTAAGTPMQILRNVKGKGDVD